MKSGEKLPKKNQLLILLLTGILLLVIVVPFRKTAKTPGQKRTYRRVPEAPGMPDSMRNIWRQKQRRLCSM